MAITQAMCTSFKSDLLSAAQTFGPTSPDSYKIALYTSSATLDASTTAYSASNEVSSSGYTAGGLALTISTSPTTGGTTAYISFTSPVTWTGVTFTAAGALIYNTTKSNKAVAVFSFGGDQSVAGGQFNIVFPSATSTTAVLRIE
jgi:hypothetical protein